MTVHRTKKWRRVLTWSFARAVVTRAYADPILWAISLIVGAMGVAMIGSVRIAAGVLVILFAHGMERKARRAR